MKYIRGQNNVTATLNPEFLTDHATIYFKECTDCNFTVFSKCTKVLIEKCKNTSVTFTGKIMTSVVEIWKCDNFTFNIGTQIMTLQLDLCHGVNLIFSQKSFLNSIVWAGIYDLKMSFTDSPTDDLSTGFLQMKELYPDINDQFDQFIVRWLDDGKGQLLLKSEKIIRLANGFPTTEREATEWDAKSKANKEKMEAYVRKLVEEKLPRLKQSGPQTLRRRLSSSGGWNQKKGKENKETKKEVKSEQKQQVNDNKEEQKIEQKSEDKKHEDKKHEDKKLTEQTVEDKNLQTNVKAVEKESSHKEPEKKPEEEKKDSSHKEPEKKLEEEKKDSSHKEPEKKPEEEKKDKPYVLHAQWG